MFWWGAFLQGRRSIFREMKNHSQNKKIIPSNLAASVESIYQSGRIADQKERSFLRKRLHAKLNMQVAILQIYLVAMQKQV